MYFNNCLLDISGFFNKAIQPFTTSLRLCGGMSVAIPTAMPVVPFNKILGKRAGKVTGSLNVPSKLSCQSTVPCPSSANKELA